MEKSQEYFNSVVKEAGEYLKQKNKISALFMKELKDNKKDISMLIKNGGLLEDDLDKYFKSSVISNDVRKLYEKVADLYYFLNKLEINIDVNPAFDLLGFKEFFEEYKPYTLNFIIENDTLKVKNEKNYSEAKKIFQKMHKNKELLEIYGL